jgi:hypothetical protein
MGSLDFGPKINGFGSQSNSPRMAQDQSITVCAQSENDRKTEAVLRRYFLLIGGGLPRIVQKKKGGG